MSKPAPRLKLVIRRLPPTLPADTFWNVVCPFVDDGKSVWRRYVPGRLGDNYGGHPIHSRAYVLMSSPDALVAFHAGFDGHLFRSKAGAEYQAVVEYAPVEKTPFKAKAKTDQRQGTIDDDPDFMSFLDSLAIVIPKPPLETSVAVPQPTTTPLLDALRAAANKSKSKSAKKKDKAAAKADKAEKEGGAKAAALAAINDAASKRAPKEKGGPSVVMVAGKGREVYVGPADEVSGGSATKDGNKEKKKRPAQNKSKAKAKDKDGGKDGSKSAAGDAESSQAARATEDGPSKDSKSGGRRGKGRGKGKGVAAGAGGDPGEGSGTTPGASVGAESKRGKGKGVAAGAGAGGDTGEGSGATPGASVSAEGKRGKGRGVTVLSRPPDSAGRGGRGRGGGTAELRPNEARIDM